MRLGAKNQRVGFLDEARGLCLCLMVLYHGAYDLVYLFGIDIPAFHWPLLHYLQLFFAGVFILISGICCRYSHSNLKRGAIALLVGVGVSVVTGLVMPGQAILFGILHFLGVSMMLFALLRPLLDRLPSFWGLLVMALLLLFFWNLPKGWVGIFGLRLPLPEGLYRLGFLFPLGFAGQGFASADYFPLLPWLFCFLAGSYLGVAFVQREMPAALYRGRSRFLAGVGRRSLLVYVLHQPVLYLLLSALHMVAVWVGVL